jgi:hypothetical protein
MAVLDDESKRSAFLSAVRSGRKVEAAAREVGVSGRSARNYAARHEDFRTALDVARRQAKIAAHHGPRLPAQTTKSKTAEVMLGVGPEELDASDPDAFLALVVRHANDGDSRACSKALEILDRWHNAEHYLAVQARAKLEAKKLEQAGEKSTRPVVVRVPSRRPDSAVIEAELVNPGETRH